MSKGNLFPVRPLPFPFPSFPHMHITHFSMRETIANPKPSCLAAISKVICTRGRRVAHNRPSHEPNMTFSLVSVLCALHLPLVRPLSRGWNWEGEAWAGDRGFW